MSQFSIESGEVRDGAAGIIRNAGPRLDQASRLRRQSGARHTFRLP